MPENISSVMTSDPACCDAEASVVDAAKLMEQRDIGDVLVMEGGQLCGIVTDRDIAVRAIAQGKDPSSTRIGEICTHEIVSLAPGDSIDDAISTMRDRAIRRLPVIESGRPVGIVSLGDLAEERDRRSLLGEISAAPSNN